MAKEELLEVFCEFFNDGIVNKKTKATFICLIPKKDVVFSVKDFRLISLLGYTKLLPRYCL